MLRYQQLPGDLGRILIKDPPQESLRPFSPPVSPDHKEELVLKEAITLQALTTVGFSFNPLSFCRMSFLCHYFLID